ncbi:UNVERIFIED_CONTAM: hypothetical protein GTU68_003576 [Idotea baltica]|nr:hypothetical protein [Idotea baltica]
MRQTSSQMAVCTMSLATSEKRKDSSGNWGDHTEWHRVVSFGKTAEFCSNYLKKGRQVYVEGKIRTNKWQDKEGKDRYTTEILANNIQFVGNKADGGGDYSNNNQASSFKAADVPGIQTAESIDTKPVDSSFDDDDIPF